MNLCNLKKSFADYQTKGWDRLFVLVDVHGTITPSGQHAEFTFINEAAKEVLQWFSKREECRLILWTSSYPDEVNAFKNWLSKHGIHIYYTNENPEAKDTPRACFDKKPYYNIVIDDRAGFEPATDWVELKCQLIELGEWYKV